MNAEEIAKLAAGQAEHEDYTKEAEHKEFDRDLPKEGLCVLRFREYIEIGQQKTATEKYPKKKPQQKARFVFELTTPKHTYEVGEGEDKKKYGHIIAIQVPISNSPKSNFMKLFKQLNWDGAATVPAQKLGQAYKGEIVHAYDKADLVDGKPKADAKPKWANLQKDGVYTLEAPRTTDPLAETITELNVPEMLGELKIFLWSNPTKETWDSLFIDGTYTKEGSEEELSKNWLQQACLAALDYEGSLLHQLLAGGGETLDDLPTEEEPPLAEPDAGEPDIGA